MNMNSVVGQMPLKWLKTLMRCLVTMWQTSELCADGLRGFDPTDYHFFKHQTTFYKENPLHSKNRQKHPSVILSPLALHDSLLWA